MRSPRFRRVPFTCNGVSDHGRAVAPRMTVRNMLPSTLSTVSASAELSLSRLNIPLHMIAVYASRPPSPATTQHLLQGGSLLPYPRRTFTGWTTPALPGARRGREPVTPVPPHRSRRAAFPHRAPIEGQTRSRVWTPPIRRLAASVTCLFRYWARGMRRRSPSLRSAAFPPPSPPLTLASFVRGFIGTMQPSELLTASATASSPRLPVVARIRQSRLGEMRSPRFRRVPFRRNGVSDHGRAIAPRIAVRNMLPSTLSTASASAKLSLSRLNIPLRVIAVYASRPPSPTATQHSLKGGALPPYPHRTFTGWNAPASPGARRGREPSYPGPPAQIPACGFPAPGSYRRSDAIAGVDAADP